MTTATNPLTLAQAHIASYLSSTTSQIVSHRRKIIESVSAGECAVLLTSLCNELAFMEGELSVYMQISQTPEHAKEIALGSLTYSTYDTWSGRNNDNRRAFADGRREAAVRFVK